MSKEAEADILAIFAPLGEELARDIIQHRKGLKCPLTARGAKGLMKEYMLAGNPIEAAEYHLNQGWRGFDHAWMKKQQPRFQPAQPRAGDMSSYANEIMDRYHEREREFVQAASDRSAANPMASLAAPGGVRRTWDA